MDPTRPRQLTVLAAPGHAPNMSMSTINAMVHTRAAIVCPSEAYRVCPNTPGVLEPTSHLPYRIVLGHSSTDTRMVRSPAGDAGDNPVLVHYSLPVTGNTIRRVDPGSRTTRDGGKFTPERWLYVVHVDWHGTPVTIVSVHPRPLFVGRVQWARAMAAALRAARRARRKGRAVVLVGDLQTASRMLRTMLRAAGLRGWCVGVTWLAWSGLRLVDRTVRKPDQLPRGIDHAWLLGTFEKP